MCYHVYMTYTEQGTTLRQRRIALRLHQKDIAAEAGLNQATVSNVELGNRVSKASLDAVFDAMASLEAKARAER